MDTGFDPRRIYRLQNEIQPYAWGSAQAIPELLGRPNPEQTPQAELWMGAHPKAASKVELPGRLEPLDVLIAAEPDRLLGSEIVRRFGPRLPFLFKVLSASRALSIQAHPNREQAREGFERENARGVPLDSPERNYRDDNHKPEILCALSEFWGMRGFRSAEAISEDLTLIGVPALERLAGDLGDGTTPESARLRGFLSALLALQREEAKRLTEEVVARCESVDADRFRWVCQLERQYPGDIGTLGPLFLNVVRLAPGEAVYQQAGELHAYLEGTGIELMANSDNVLRGGLTPKHIDTHELMSVLRFEVGQEGIIRPMGGGGLLSYRTPTDEFRLARLSCGRGNEYRSEAHRSVELLLCVDGGGEVVWPGEAGGRMKLDKGDSLLVPAGVPSYELNGELKLFRADVALQTVPG